MFVKRVDFEYFFFLSDLKSSEFVYFPGKISIIPGVGLVHVELRLDFVDFISRLGMFLNFNVEFVLCFFFFLI